MFQTKICGITTVSNALALVDSGVQAVGLNFFEASKRYVKPGIAREISNAIPKNIERVGVFVNASSDTILTIVKQVELDYVQLHGDEPPEFLCELKEVPIIRAFRTNGDLTAVEHYLARCKTQPWAILVDAYDANEYGGTGKTLNWSDVRNRPWSGEIPMVLAGGLRPENVGAAIKEASPDAVDTASGVELDGQPGIKDPDLSAAFVKVATLAFSN